MTNFTVPPRFTSMIGKTLSFHGGGLIDFANFANLHHATAAKQKNETESRGHPLTLIAASTTVKTCDKRGFVDIEVVDLDVDCRH